jgi:hypothetical protein
VEKWAHREKNVFPADRHYQGNRKSRRVTGNGIGEP